MHIHVLVSLVFKCLQYSSLPPFNVSLLISNTFPFLSLSSMSAASAFSLSLLRALMTSVHVPGGYTPVHLVPSSYSPLLSCPLQSYFVLFLVRTGQRFAILLMVPAIQPTGLL